jgi:hypothetical protein
MTPKSKQTRYINCPFCSGLIEPKIGQTKCPECKAKFTYDDRLESVFVDLDDLRLPIKGNVCSNCGLLQDYGGGTCLYCGKELSSTIHQENGKCVYCGEGL